MLEAYCKILAGIGSCDNGVETVLSPMAFEGLIDLTRAVYGDHAAEVVSNQFMLNDNGGYYSPMEEIEEAFRLTLTGIG